MINLDIDTPHATREVVGFKDGKRGLLIHAAKARGDAEVFRWIAGVIRKGKFSEGQKADVDRAAGALNRLAEQFEAAPADEAPGDA